MAAHQQLQFLVPTVARREEMSLPSATSVFKLVNGLRHFGVGAKVTRSIYKFPETFWVITRVNLSKDQNHGKVHGRLVWRGIAKPKDMKIGRALKKDWKLLEVPGSPSFKGEPAELEQIIASCSKPFVPNTIPPYMQERLDREKAAALSQ